MIDDMEKEPSKIKHDILVRVRGLHWFFVLLVITIFLRLVWVQFFSGEVRHNADRLAKRIFSEEVIPARRGTILSRDGEPLATSLFRYQVNFDFASEGLDSTRIYLKQADSLSKLLANFFQGKSAKEYSRMFREERKKHYSKGKPIVERHLRSDNWLGQMIDRLRGEEYVETTTYEVKRVRKLVKLFPREVDYGEWKILKEYPLLNWNMGMVYQLVERDDRVYPQGELARRTIGKIKSVGGDQRLTEEEKRLGSGIEMVYRKELAGRDGHARRQRIARGFYGRVPGSHVEPEDGYDIVTTLDMDLQEVADRALRKQLTEQNAHWGTTIVMETRTGEILTMVNLGRNAKGEIYERMNYAIGRSYEPGSTFKTATMIALLDDAGMPLDQTYDTNDAKPVKVGPVGGVTDTHRGEGEIGFYRAAAVSSNVYYTSAVWDYYGLTGKKKDFSDFLRKKLHLGERVGFEEFGEPMPEIETDWKEVADPGVKLVKMAYGYRVKLTPMQLITFYNAVANDGRMISPVLVKAFMRGDEVVEKFKTRTIASSICSSSTLKHVRFALERVATEGTAMHFFRDTTRLRVAAKTGTALVTNPEAMAKNYRIGSMVAYFPADDPKYTILTVVETHVQPGKTHYGAGLAGPVVSRMVKYIHNRGINPYDHIEGEDHYPTRVKGGDIKQVVEVGDEFSPKVETPRRSGWGSVKVDSLSRVVVSEVTDDLKRMPNLRGMGLKDALFLLEQRGLKVRFTGKGGVRRQSLPAGSIVRPGMTVTITLE